MPAVRQVVLVFSIMVFFSAIAMAAGQEKYEGYAEINKYYKAVFGRSLIDYQSRFSRLRLQSKEIVNRGMELIREKRKLMKECGKPCKKEISVVAQNIDANRKELGQVTNEMNELNKQTIQQDYPLTAIYAAIMEHCRNTEMRDYYNDMGKVLISVVEKNNIDEAIKLKDIHKNTLVRSRNDILSGVFHIDCKWEVLQKSH